MTLPLSAGTVDDVSAPSIHDESFTGLHTAIDDAAQVLRGRQVTVLTGAGISTDSGIPDYRGPNSPRHTPMTIADFLSGPATRRRYWARSHIGWERIRLAAPNAGHRALAALQTAGAAGTVITQNVDGLHDAAGAVEVIDLHGRLDTVICLSCGTRSSRSDLRARLDALNPGWRENITDSTVRPDGDVEITDTDTFVIADCATCGGILKPDVVFFGENVPAERVRASYAAVAAADALLVVGSSLTVMSGLRFVKRAAASGTPIVIVNRGKTRGDGYATVRLDDGCSEVLTALEEQLLPQPDSLTRPAR